MKRFLPLVVVVTFIWAGCGGGSKSSSTSTTVSVTVSPTTASLAGGATQQFTATVTNTTNTAVTWKVNGETGGDAVIGTITTTGLYTAPAKLPTTTTVTITATSVADTTQSAAGVVTLTAPTVTISISPTNARVAAGSTQQFKAAVTSADNNQAVTWSVVGCTVAASCGTVDQTGLYTAPLSPPREAITVVAQSQANTAFTASAPVTIQFGNASLTGNYVFLLTQADNASGAAFSLRAGTFTADGKGGLTGGIEDFNSAAGSSGGVPVNFTGSYVIAADGRGTATINDAAAHKLSFALTSNTRGQMIGFDSSQAAGIIRLQDPTAAMNGPTGSFVFALSGDNGGSAAAVGQLSFSNGSVTGTEDANNVGTVTKGTGLAGVFTIGPSGRGTITLNRAFAYYTIDAATLALIDTGASGARLAGIAYAQPTASFTAANLGTSAYIVGGNAVPGNKPYGQAGRFDTDFKSALTNGVFDSNNAGTATTNSPFTGATYTLAQNGRGTLATGNSNFIFWLASATQGVIMSSDSTVVASGLLFQQQTGIPSISGEYEFVVGGASADGTANQAIDGQLTVTGFGVGVLSGTEDLNAGGSLQAGASISGNLTIAASERGTVPDLMGTVTVNGTSTVISSVSYSFYLINANRFLMLSTSSGSVLVGIGERQCSDCSF